MDLITSFVSAFAAFVGSLAAHFIAHDAYRASPKYAARILQSAANRLPFLMRQRFSEEWQAHLEECGGVFGKFNHAIGCWLCAWTLSSTYKAAAPQYIEFEVSGAGIVRLDFATGVRLLAITNGAMGHIRSGADINPQERQALFQTVDQRCSELGPINLKQYREAIELFDSAQPVGGLDRYKVEFRIQKGLYEIQDILDGLKL